MTFGRVMYTYIEDDDIIRVIFGNSIPRTTTAHWSLLRTRVRDLCALLLTRGRGRHCVCEPCDDESYEKPKRFWTHFNSLKNSKRQCCSA